MLTYICIWGCNFRFWMKIAPRYTPPGYHTLERTRGYKRGFDFRLWIKHCTPVYAPRLPPP